MNKGGLIVSKKEMTKIWIDNNFLPVTLVKVLPQEVIRYKNNEKDGYVAAVIGIEKKKQKAGSGKQKADGKAKNAGYKIVTEIKVDQDFVEKHEAGKVLDSALLEGIKEVNVIGYAKGKGFQGVMKLWHSHGMPATHGHKFTRVGGSKGNRKPRRVQKGHPHAGHMGTQRINLKNIAVLDVIKRDNEQLLVLKGSLPGAYNGMLTLLVN